MQVFHIELAKVGTGLSGGEKCMVEVIKYFKKNDIQNVLVTTDNGKKLYVSLGLNEDANLRYLVINSYWSEQRFHIFLSYLIRLFYLSKIKNQIDFSANKEKDVLICHSDYFPNTILSHRLRNSFSNKYYWFHMLAPKIFYGFEGHFTKRIHFPTPSVIHYNLNQLLFKYVARNGLVITNSSYYKDIFKTPHYNIKRYSGVKIPEIQNQTKEFDLAFLGRFHAQKGLFEIPKIIKLLKETKPDIKILIIGGGNKKIEEKFKKIVVNSGLENNIIIVGKIDSDAKFIYLQKTKVFIFPSYYESFGQVALEAMACGLPVVAYDLPVFSIFQDKMLKVPVLDNRLFAEKVLFALDNYIPLGAESKAFSETFSWDKTGEEVRQLISKNV